MNYQRHAPLVVFTSLAVSGAGLVAADAVLMATAHVPMYVPAIALGVALQAAGVAVSLLHLGKKARAPLAGRRIGPSALSNEILMAGLAVASSAALLVVATRGGATGPCRALAGITSAAFLLAIGLVYRLRGQLTWIGPAALTPLSAGCALGAVFIQALSISGGVPRGVVFLMGADSALFLLRWQEAAAVDGGASSVSGGPPWRRRHEWFAVRFFLLDVVPFALVFFWPTPLAIVSAAAGLVVDRVAFYGLAVQHTTEREIDRVEEAIRSAGPPHKS